MKAARLAVGLRQEALAQRRLTGPGSGTEHKSGGMALKPVKTTGQSQSKRGA